MAEITDPVSTDPTVDELVEEAFAAALDPYADAVAWTVLGHPEVATTAWIEFSDITQRALVLADFAGRSDVWASMAEVPGFSLEAEVEAGIAQPAQFQETVLPEWLRPHEIAFRIFERRVPRLASIARAAIAAADEQARRIALDEATSGVVDIVSRSTALQEIARSSFFVTGLDVEQTRQVHGLVSSVLQGAVPEEIREAEGIDPEARIGLAEFIDRAQAEAAGGLTQARLEVVYRNNLNGAFADAQVQSLSRPDTQVFLPLVEINEAQDIRTRGNPNGLYPEGYHYQMDGYIGTLADIQAKGMVFPNGHNCRGSLRSLTIAEAQRRGFMDAQGNIDRDAIREFNGPREEIVARGLYPDPGFAA